MASTGEGLAPSSRYRAASVLMRGVENVGAGATRAGRPGNAERVEMLDGVIPVAERAGQLAPAV
jgi:hypothetical protein